jgi:hypothetical protein
MKSQAGILVGAMHAPCECSSTQKVAMFLRQARAEEGLQLRGPGYACYLAFSFR